MRIGIDTTCWINARGYGRFTREILKAMVAGHSAHEYVFITDSVTYPQCRFPEGVRVVNVPVKDAAANAASYSGHRPIQDIYNMGRIVSKEPLDILFYPSVYTYFPVFSRAKKIVTIHDTIPELYPELVFPNLKTRLFWKLKTRMALYQADLVLTVSEHSKESISTCFKLDKKKIAVTPEAADVYFKPKSKNNATTAIVGKYGLSEDDRYFIYVGGISPHKNLRTLIRAFHKLQKRTAAPERKLLIVGDLKDDTFWMDDTIREIANTNGGANGILFTGYVPDEDLPYLYSGAEACVLPSFSEGFGLPALEAMACRTAVIGSKTTSLPEVVGEAGLFFDPQSSQELSDCMERIYTKPSLRNSLGKAGLRRAKSFTWKNAANEVVKTMERLAASK